VLFGPEGFGQGAQDLRQEGNARLARSAGAGGEGGQADVFSRHRCSFRAAGNGSGRILHRLEAIIQRRLRECQERGVVESAPEVEGWRS